MSDERAGAESSPGDRLQAADTEQIADIRRYPFLARLDEPVLVEPFDIGVQGVELIFEDRHQRAERLALSAVTDAIHGGQQVVEAAGRRAHDCISVKVIPAGLTIRS